MRPLWVDQGAALVRASSKAALLTVSSDDSAERVTDATSTSLTTAEQQAIEHTHHQDEGEHVNNQRTRIMVERVLQAIA